MVGNWKMNPQSLDEAKEIVREVKKITAKLKKTEVVLCPPFVYVGSVSSSPKNNIYFGAQDAHPEASGSFTGEVSSSQLYQFGVRFVIVGHSERRKMGESDELVNKKVKSVLGEGMTAILCVGEDKRDHHGEYFNFIKSQILLGLKDVQKKVLLRVVIAYEPIWAIGAKEAVKPSELHEMSIFIRKVLKDLYGPFGDDVKILYGGSADKINAESLVREGNVAGLLVGRESLRPKAFIEMIKIIDSI